MKVAVASLGPDLTSPVAPSFGRAPFIIIAEVENNEIKSYESLQNPVLMMPGGRGITLSQLLLSKGVNMVIAGQFGGNVYTILSQAGVTLYSSPPLTVRDAIMKAIRGELPPGMPVGRWGGGRGW